MKVLKFGGTSVGSVDSILSVKRIVEGQMEPSVVVVSALGGITDKLIATSRLAVSGDAAYTDSFNEIVKRHHDVINDLITDQDKKNHLLTTVDSLFNELKSIYQGVYLIRDLSEKTSNVIVSYGERISSHIVANAINGAKRFDALSFIKTSHELNLKFELYLKASAGLFLLK